MIFHDRRRLGAIQRPFVATSGLPHTVPDVYLYYPFDNASTSGSTCQDKSGNGFNGTIAGFVTTGVTGQIAQGYSAPGTVQTTQGITAIPSLPLIGGNAARSLCWWSNSTSNGAGQVVFSIGDTATTGDGFQIYLDYIGTASFANGGFALYMGASWIGTMASGLFPVDGSAYTHFAITYDGGVMANANFKFYVNGASQTLSSTTPTGAALNTTPTTGAYIMYQQTTGFLYNGMIDDFRIYARMLSGAEVSSIYTAGVGGGS